MASDSELAKRELQRRGIDPLQAMYEMANAVYDPLLSMGAQAGASILGGIGSFISAPYVGVDKALQAQRNVQTRQVW